MRARLRTRGHGINTIGDLNDGTYFNRGSRYGAARRGPRARHWQQAAGSRQQRETTRIPEITHLYNPSSREQVHQLANENKRRVTQHSAQHSVLVTHVPSYQCS